jgi:hypothetical protein
LKKRLYYLQKMRSDFDFTRENIFAKIIINQTYLKSHYQSK